MILHRFTQALRNQQWFTVVLEILIIVIAIFLGLQVDDWNEDRKIRQEVSSYLEELNNDLMAMQTDLVDRIEIFDVTVQRMIAALYALEACDSSTDAISDVSYSLEHYQVWPPFDFLDATYSEMVASGSLARIQNIELKQKIAYTYSALGDLNARLRDLRVSMPYVDVIVWRNVSYSVEKESGRLLSKFDIAGLCDNIEMRNAFVEMIDIQFDGKSAAIRVLASVDNVIANLNADTL